MSVEEYQSLSFDKENQFAKGNNHHSVLSRNDSVLETENMGVEADRSQAGSLPAIPLSSCTTGTPEEGCKTLLQNATKICTEVI